MLIVILYKPKNQTKYPINLYFSPIDVVKVPKVSWPNPIYPTPTLTSMLYQYRCDNDFKEF